MEAHQLFEKITQVQSTLSGDRLSYWKEHVLFSFDWWVLILFFSAGWFLWWKVVDRSRLLEFIFVGVIILFMAMKLDLAGVELGLWDYPVMVMPWGSKLLLVDAVLPMFYMMIFQLAASWRKYLFYLTIMSLVFSFILEPIMVEVGVYHPMNWKHLYSFPGYILVGVAARGLGQWLYRQVIKHQNRATASS